MSTSLTPGETAELRNLFIAGAAGVYDGDTLSGYTIRELRHRRLAERRESDGRNIITEGGVAELLGGAR